MKRILIISAIVAGAGAVAAPAVAGLSGNPSFSHDVPVRVPAEARIVQFDDHGGVLGEDAASRHNRVPSPSDTSHGLEPGGDHSRDASSSPSGGDGASDDASMAANSAEPEPELSDDPTTVSSSSSASPHPEFGDDHGGLSPHLEPGDDSRSSSSATPDSGGSPGGS